MTLPEKGASDGSKDSGSGTGGQKTLVSNLLSFRAASATGGARFWTLTRWVANARANFVRWTCAPSKARIELQLESVLPGVRRGRQSVDAGILQHHQQCDRCARV